MRLTERFRPQTLGDVVGQSCVPLLQAYVANPYSACWLFEGPPGTGKTSASLAMVSDLCCEESAIMVPCSELNTDRARELLRGLALKPMFGTGKWQVLLLEELETLHPQCQTLMKVGLDSANLPKHAIVIATSNGTEKLQPALVQRFNRLLFTGDRSFANAGQLELCVKWNESLPGVSMPPGWQQWGFDPDRNFSLRVALEQLEMALLQHAGSRRTHCVA